MINRSYTTALTGITTKDYFETKIPRPSLQEQNKISSILVKIDSKVSELQDQKTKLEKLKKGMMQKLLTGQIRV